jgi:hypothetical protein
MPCVSALGGCSGHGLGLISQVNIPLHVSIEVEGSHGEQPKSYRTSKCATLYGQVLPIVKSARIEAFHDQILRRKYMFQGFRYNMTLSITEEVS